MSLNDTTLHYSSKRKRVYVRASLESRFWKHVNKTDTCWLWTGATAGFGYGVINAGGNKGRTLRTHRVSWELHYGAIPDGLFVCHHCDTPACVRPDHLFLGTNADNVHDMYAKGREDNTKRVSGEKHHNAKLNQQQAYEIRVRYANEHQSIELLASEFGVHMATISNIVHGKVWRHAGGPICTSNMRSGENNRSAVLTGEDVTEIRRLFADGSHTRPQLADAYGVSRQTIHRIIHRIIWKHV